MTNEAGRLPMFSSLANRDFRVFVIGQGISMLGTWMQFIGQALLVLDLSNSGVALGAITATQFIPVLLMTAWAGALADRVDRRRLMIITQTVMMLLAAVLGVLVLAGRATLGAVFVIAGLTGIARAIDDPSRRVIVGDFVSERELANGLSLNNAVVNVSRLIGPSLAAIVIGTLGIGWCFVLNAVSFLAVIGALSIVGRTKLHRPQLPPAPSGQVRAGLRYAWNEPALRIPLLLIAVVSTFAFNWNVLLPLLSTRDFHGGPNTYALLSTLIAVGSLSGSLWAARLGVISIPAMARWCCAIGITTLTMAFAPTVAAAGGAALATGFCAMVLLSTAMSALQLSADPTMRGRVMALFSLVFLGSTPIGGPLSGWLGEHYGARVALGFGAIAAVLAGISAILHARQTRRPVSVEARPVVADAAEQA